MKVFRRNNIKGSPECLEMYVWVWGRAMTVYITIRKPELPEVIFRPVNATSRTTNLTVPRS
jgi:hypothetical protein